MRRLVRSAFCAPGFLRPYRTVQPTRTVPSASLSGTDMTLPALRRIGEISRMACARAAGKASSFSLWRRPPPPPRLTEGEIAEIADCVRKVDADDLGVPRSRFGGIDREIAYVPVADSPAAVLAVFVLPPGTRIPLHDHPEMYVFSKVLWGELNVESFDVVDGAESPGGKMAIRNPDEVSKAGEVRILDPVQGNIHCFQSDIWTAVFDVVLPPYDEHAGRECTYYRAETSRSMGAQQQRVALQAVQPPDDFLMCNLEYTGVRLQI